MAEQYEVTEGVEGYWHYHLSILGQHTVALCGRKTMTTSIPVEKFGIGKAAPPNSKINGRWCSACAEKHRGR